MGDSMKKIIFIIILILSGTVNAHTVTLNLKFNISDSDVIHANGTEYNSSSSVNHTWTNMSKKYILSEYQDFTAGVAYSGEEFVNIILDKEENQYFFRMKQTDDNKFSIFFTKTNWTKIDEKIISVGKLMRKTFGTALSLSNPSSIFLQLHYSYVDIINNEQWGSGAHEIIIKNTGRIGGKNQIKIEKVR